MMNHIDIDHGTEEFVLMRVYICHKFEEKKLEMLTKKWSQNMSVKYDI